MATFNVPPWVRCTQCGAPQLIEQRNFYSHFEGGSVECNTCKTLNDFWGLAVHEVTDNFMLNQAFALLLAQSTMFQFVLEPGKTAQYKLEDHGVPADAKVLYVNYTPAGNLFPLEIHGNVPTLRRPREVVYLWPMPPRNGDEPKNTEVFCMTTWVPHSKLEESWQNLVASLEGYAASNFQSAIVPANVAVESSLAITLNEYLPRYMGKERAESLLKDAATYSHQLNALLPLITGILGIPKLPDVIRGHLNTLRGLRNDMAHRGGPRAEITKAQCAELVTAAIFSFHYVRYLRQKLTGAT